MYDALQKMEREKYPEVKVASSEPTPDDIVLDDKLVSYFQPSSMVAEQFRRLRQYIIKPGIDDSPKALLVTSAMAGEGKSLIAINLAITIAIELHSHALLVDCDLRNPSLSRFFGLHEALGLSDYLQGNVELDGLFVKTSVDKLSVLCGGSLQDNPVELIGSNKMKSLIQDLRSRYNDRYIILDSSPLLATTEPSVLNEMVDGILYVVKAGETPRETVVQAMNLLRKEKIMGVVLNSVEFKTQALIRRYFGMHHYYYDYRYSKTHPAPGMRGRLSLFTKDMKAMMFGRKDKK